MPSTTRRRFLCGLIGAGGLLGLSATGWLRRGELSSVTRTSHALGTEVSITALHENPDVAERAITAAFAELNLIEDVMSLYRPHSQLSRLNRDGVLNDPHPHFVQVLATARRMSERSAGAFDVTVQPLWSLHAAAQKAGRTPSATEIDAARSGIDWRRVDVSPSRIVLRGDGTAVTLNGIAQGFATDRATSVLRSYGIEHALINAGELTNLGDKEDGQPWTVGIQHPRRDDAWISLARLDGRCLATSGDYATTFSADRSRHHIFDPHTGHSPAEFASVSVVAATGLEADALSTAIFVAGLDRGLELIRSTPGADALFVLKSGRVLQTDGFPASA